MQTMLVQTRFLRLFQPVAVGDRIDGWRVCWLGGWDKGHVCFVVMVARKCASATAPFSLPAPSPMTLAGD